ncbi:TPA: tRNA (N6-isopentenyl adenosine(37)-C2)-methylthiotransferase MiaB [Candidatus Bipolaricaulota bacterium]|nr:tRNA (N6-isopentenyl adenosine(37)-C2)-methylthiotransferase MiaB [Candidatus Bipolaricaulota bacterium]
MKACVLTWGCQLNAHRSEEIEGVLEQAGYRLVDRPEEADVVILNTCMVRQRAEEKVIGRVGELARLRRQGTLIGVGGCMAQGRKEELFQLAPGIDFAFGTAEIARLPELIDRARRGERPGHFPAPLGWEHLPVRRRSPFKAYVTVAEGCSHACSYCIVPFVRGPLRSRPLPEILEELRELAGAGYQEVTLLGQNVDAYGKDLGDGTDFASLLRGVARVAIPRIRFTSSHPAYMTEDTIAAIAEGGNICEHVHLAVQSGSDRILRAMRRGYTRDGFLRIVDRLRAAVPGINITTDIIVGFPGETERDFEDTLSLIEEVGFGTVYVATYSPRPYTRAGQLSDSVPREEKARRLQEVLSLTRRIAHELHRRHIGDTVEVLVEGYLPEKARYYGKTRDFRTVLLSGEERLVGKFVAVRVEAASPGAMEGSVVKEPVA